MFLLAFADSGMTDKNRVFRYAMFRENSLSESVQRAKEVGLVLGDQFAGIKFPETVVIESGFFERELSKTEIDNLSQSCKAA
jgi:hypothetical protein